MFHSVFQNFRNFSILRETLQLIFGNTVATSLYRLSQNWKSGNLAMELIINIFSNSYFYFEYVYNDTHPSLTYSQQSEENIVSDIYQQ